MPYKDREKRKECLKKWLLENVDRRKQHLKKYNNKDSRRKDMNKYYRNNREAWIQIIQERKMDFCVNCGFKIFVALDFHHINPHEKEKSISLLMGQKPTPERIKELEKCIVLCSNCHRIEHDKTRRASMNQLTGY